MDAGKKLSHLLGKYRGQNVIVYGLTRGGVPVAYEVALYLNAPLEALIVKKIGAPHQEELAVGAIVEGKDPHIYYNDEILAHLQLHPNDLKDVVKEKKKQILEMEKLIRPDRRIQLDSSAIAMVVDDGIATGSTMRAAIDFFRRSGQSKIVVAVPLGQVSVLGDLGKIADEVICADPLPYMEAVGEFYKDFSQVESDVVAFILGESRKRMRPET